MTNPDSALLDNPIWYSLRTDQGAIAEGDDRARRYPHDIGPLAGIRDQSAESYRSLGRIAGDHPVALFSVEPFRIPASWTQLRDGTVIQMVRERQGGRVGGALSAATASSLPRVGNEPRSASGTDNTILRKLTASDAPAMVALAELTEPGPFRLRTLELGNFYGIFHGDQLVSMAGKRMHLPGFIEVSGVCTHPDVRGRGYARTIMQIVMDEIEQAGRTPFLHAWHDNPAVRLYETLGFTLRQSFHLAVLKHES